VTKLYATGLAYEWFALYQGCEILTALTLRGVGQGSNLYAVARACSKPVLWLLCLGVVLEIYSLVMPKYPGISSVMCWAVTGAAGLSLAVSVLCLSFQFSNPNEKLPLLRYAFRSKAP
jgi:hypothetical protein